MEFEVGLPLKRLQCLVFTAQELKEPTQHLILFKDSKMAKRVRNGHILRKKKRFAFSLNVESVDWKPDTRAGANHADQIPVEIVQESCAKKLDKFSCCC